MGDNEDRGWGEDEDCDEGGMGVRGEKGGNLMQAFCLRDKASITKVYPHPC